MPPPKTPIKEPITVKIPVIQGSFQTKLILSIPTVINKKKGC